MESHASVAAFKEGFLEVLHQHGYEKADIPHLMQKCSDWWNIPAEMVEAGGRAIGAVLPAAADAVFTQIPAAMVGAGALGGGTLALITAQNEARKIKLADEENRLNRLIATSEEANRARLQEGLL